MDEIGKIRETRCKIADSMANSFMQKDLLPNT